MTAKKAKIGYRRKKGAKKAHARSRSMPGATGRSASTNDGTVGRDSDDTCGGDETSPVDVDDGNGEEDQGNRGAEEEACAHVHAVEEEAAEYRRLRDRAQLRPKKLDRRLLPMTQLEIMLGNHWKERVRCAYDTAAELADELAESYKENEELRAKIRELQSPPSPLVE